jgi:hypothetical protein
VDSPDQSEDLFGNVSEKRLRAPHAAAADDGCVVQHPLRTDAARPTVPFQREIIFQRRSSGIVCGRAGGGETSTCRETGAGARTGSRIVLTSDMGILLSRPTDDVCVDNHGPRSSPALMFLRM